ncbi:MAG: hypothetical protein H0Z19_03205 [Archaeoglobus sp.]|uniref:hypothetical protein n=1 Tax=Archaeoglobus sp. TaxID=1872626 RepID=UPI001D274312|nr:hypothetical protein [Archaeoglobus sp.]MBO8179475.1 hypothetical protein [Archaeoglobus sp.]
MRSAIAILLLALIGLASYHTVMSQVNIQDNQVKSVNLVDKKLTLKGFDNPTVRIGGCGEEVVIKGSFVEIPLNCSNVSIEVYSNGKLAFTGTFSLNP